MPTLFEIGSDLAALNDLLDEAGGELSSPEAEAAVEAWFAAIAADESAKLDSYCSLILMLEMETSAAKKEADAYAQKARTRENRVAWLKGRLLAYLAATGRKKVQTATGRTVSIQANGGAVPVVLDEVDPLALPERFRRTVTTADRDAVRKALDAGETLPFARYGERAFHLRVR